MNTEKCEESQCFCIHKICFRLTMWIIGHFQWIKLMNSNFECLKITNKSCKQEFVDKKYEIICWVQSLIANAYSKTTTFWDHLNFFFLIRKTQVFMWRYRYLFVESQFFQDIFSVMWMQRNDLVRWSESVSLGKCARMYFEFKMYCFLVFT